jgi:hypothetical protein
MYARYLGTEQQLKWRIKQTFIRGRWVVKHGIHYFNAKRGGHFAWNEVTKEYYITTNFNRNEAAAIMHMLHRT